MGEIRAGIVNPSTWPKVFLENNKVWLSQGGCPLGIGVSKEQCKADAPFNFFPTSRDAVIEWSEEAASNIAHVASEKAEGATIDVARLPFLNHELTKLRPTLVAFEVTGHVMLGIIYNHEGSKGPTIHILNPWSMTESQQFKDVFELINAKLGYEARKVIVVDVTAELEKKIKPKIINFQAYEKQGFCTLWVGIFAWEAIPYLSRLHTSVADTIHTAVNPEQQLNESTLKLYEEIYNKIGTKWITEINKYIEKFKEFNCMPTASAATAVVNLAILAGAARRGGKRKPRRQTKRKPLYRNRWTRKQQNRR